MVRRAPTALAESLPAHPTRHARQAVQALAQFAVSERARQELLGFLTRRASAFTAVDRLRLHISLQARPLLTHGTGAMEKSIETVIARRFKRWGMRWTRPGAHRLLELRLWIAGCGTDWFEALHSRSTELTDA